MLEISSVSAQDLVHDVATISLQGPKDVWFGVGFNALTMSDQPWPLGSGTADDTEDWGLPKSQTLRGCVLPSEPEGHHCGWEWRGHGAEAWISPTRNFVAWNATMLRDVILSRLWLMLTDSGACFIEKFEFYSSHIDMAYHLSSFQEQTCILFDFCVQIPSPNSVGAQPREFQAREARVMVD